MIHRRFPLLVTKGGVPCLAAVLLLAPLLGTVTLRAQIEQPEFVLPDDPQVVVLEYHRYSGMLAERDPMPRLRIFADGRVRVYYPAYMKRAGEYELSLSPVELQELLQTLAGHGMLSFDSEVIRADRVRAEAKLQEDEGALFAVSDDTYTELRIQLPSYRPAESALHLKDFEQKFRWPNVNLDAQRYPSIQALQDLLAGVQRLRGLLDDERLRPAATKGGS